MTEWILKLSLTDERALHALLLRRNWWLDRMMGALTHAGGATVSILLATLLALGAIPGLEAAGVLGGFALATSHLAVQLVKRSVSRPRPALPVGLVSLVRAPDRFSFPSGHAAASLSVAVPAAIAIGGILGWGVVILALAVGFSRAYLGVHYPGDVVAGWLLALLGLWAGVLVGL